jgi:putative ABC transport system permease protein
MLGHYLQTVFRNLRHSKLVTVLHVLGLAVGLACFIVSFVLIQTLRNTDGQFRNSGRIYALTQELWMGNATKSITPPNPRATMAAAPFLKTDFPQLEAVARVTLYFPGKTAVAAGDRSLFLWDAVADPEFLKIFDLHFLAGDPATALARADGVVITERAARRLFDTADVLGKTVVLGNQFTMVITGVIAGVPQPSHMGDSPQSLLRFDILGRMVPEQFNGAATDWDSPNTITYALLPAGGALTPEAFRAGLRDFSDRHMPRSQGHSKFDAVQVSAIGLRALDALFGTTGVSVTTGLMLLDVLLLVVACLNYANLATALALRRSRETALRKIVGATRGQLVLQALLEALVVGVLALALALVLVLAAAPLLRNALPFNLQFGQLARPGFVVFVAMLLAATTLVAGTYPALILSRLRPVQALQSEVARVGPRSGFRALVALQFAAAGFLIVLVLVAHEQNVTMSAALPGLLRNPSVVITNNLLASAVDSRTLRTELQRSPYVTAVSAISDVPWSLGCCWLFNLSLSPDPAHRQIQGAANVVDYDFFTTLGLKMLAGRDFGRDLGDETDLNAMFRGGAPKHVIIDRSYAGRLGWANPADAVGKILYRPPLWGGVADSLLIVGVVENGAQRLIAITATASNVYILTPAQATFPIVRIDPHHVREAVAHIDTTWRTLVPRVPLERRFVDDLFGEAYSTFAMLSGIATGLSIFAFAIALMGLTGIAVHVTTARLREIGVRKTLGATTRQIVEMLLLDFAKPVVIANLVAWPFAYLAARAYLSLFLTRTGISPLPFVLSLAATVLIAWIAVGGQALRAARVEPARVLHYQ